MEIDVAQRPPDGATLLPSHTVSSERGVGGGSGDGVRLLAELASRLAPSG